MGACFFALKHLHTVKLDYGPGIKVEWGPPLTPDVEARLRSARPRRLEHGMLAEFMDLRQESNMEAEFLITALAPRTGKLKEDVYVRASVPESAASILDLAATMAPGCSIYLDLEAGCLTRDLARVQRTDALTSVTTFHYEEATPAGLRGLLVKLPRLERLIVHARGAALPLAEEARNIWEVLTATLEGRERPQCAGPAALTPAPGATD